MSTTPEFDSATGPAASSLQAEDVPGFSTPQLDSTPQPERSVARHLGLRQTQSFLPTCESVRVWKNRERIKLTLPCFRPVCSPQSRRESGREYWSRPRSCASREIIQGRCVFPMSRSICRAPICGRAVLGLIMVRRAGPVSGSIRAISECPECIDPPEQPSRNNHRRFVHTVHISQPACCVSCRRGKFWSR